MGHILPGVSFILWALWDMCHLFIVYYQFDKGKRSNSFMSFTSKTNEICGRKVPLETLAKLFFPAVGIVGMKIYNLKRIQ